MARISHPAEELLSSLPREQAISIIVDALSASQYNDATGLWLLEGLERLSCKGEATSSNGLRREFRGRLQMVYTRSVNGGWVKSETHPEFLAAILKKILEGWAWHWDTEAFGYRRTWKREEDEDAEACFVFFCGALGDWARDKKFQEIMVGFVREHLFPTNAAGWTTGWWYPTDLDRWILQESIPAEITETLLHARIREKDQGLRTALSEMAFLVPFELEQRSKEATAVAQEALQKIRLIDRTLQRIKEKAQSANRRGDRNPNSPLCFVDTLEVFYDTAESGRVVITFHRPQDINPGAIEGVRKIRDEVQKEFLSHPFIIKVHAQGPNGFTYNEP